MTETTVVGTVESVYDAANRLTSVGGVSYTWDDNGNLVSDGVRTYSYTNNKLSSITGANLNVTFQYNGLGARVSQTVNEVTTNYELDQAAGLTQILQDGANTYLYGNERIVQFSVSDSAYFLTDALGSVRQLVDANGHIRLTENYAPYGEIMGSTGSGLADYGYTVKCKAKGSLTSVLVGTTPRWDVSKVEILGKVIYIIRFLTMPGCT